MPPTYTLDGELLKALLDESSLPRAVRGVAINLVEKLEDTFSGASPFCFFARHKPRSVGVFVCQQMFFFVPAFFCCWRFFATFFCLSTQHRSKRKAQKRKALASLSDVDVLCPSALPISPICR